MKKNLLFFFLLNSLCIYAQKDRYSNNDSILINLGLSPRYFKITTRQEEIRNNYLFSIIHKETDDTLIMAKVDTIYEKVIIKNKLIPYQLLIYDKIFMNSIGIDSCTFKKEVDFFDCQFRKDLIIQTSVFESDLVFSGVICKSFLVLDYNKLYSTCNFFQSKFYGLCSQGSYFNKEFNFESDTINFACFFGKSVFNDHTIFEDSEFALSPDFVNASFNDTVDFINLKLERGIDFQSTKFKCFLALTNLVAKNEFSFKNTYLPEFIDINNLKTEFPLDFNFINDSLKNCRYKINISNTDYNKIIFTDRFSLKFDDELSIDQRNGAYKRLLESLDKSGSKQAYKSFDIEYRGFINKYYNSLFEKIGFTVNKYWWNFGYSKERIFIISIFLILLCSIQVFVKLDLYLNKVYSIKSLSERVKPNLLIRNKFKKILLNYLVALLYTIFLFFSLKLDFDKISFGKFSAGIFILFVFITGLVCTAFIINFVLKF